MTKLDYYQMFSDFYVYKNYLDNNCVKNFFQKNKEK